MKSPRVHVARSILALLLGSTAAGWSGESAKPVGFRADIAPLLNRRCVVCHNPEKSKGRYRLDTFAQLTRAGESGLPPIQAGKAGDSELYRLLVETSPDDRMPQKADALPAEEIALVERWINEGAVYDGGSPDRPLTELARESFLRPAPKHYPRPAPVTALAFSPDGSQLAVGGYFEVTLWNAADGTMVRRIGGLPERITALAWHPTRNLLAVAGGSPAQWGAVALVDPAKGFKIRYLCDLPETALSLAFSPDGSRLVAGCGDRTVRFFDTTSGQPGLVLQQHADWVQSVAFSPDGRHVASASRDRTVRIFSAANGELEGTYSGHETPVLSAAFLPDGASVLSLARGKVLHLWLVHPVKDSKPRILRLPAEAQQIAVGRFGVVTGATDSKVRVHEVSDLQITSTRSGHDDAIQSIAIDPSGEVFATGSHSGEVCVWNPARDTWVARFAASPK